MTELSMQNTVRQRRSAAGLSQSDLAVRAGVSRQALSAIESGRQVPSTLLALQLARALGCSVDELFHLPGGQVVTARCAPSTGEHRRMALGRVDGAWVAHPVREAAHAADAVAIGPATDAGEVTVELLCDAADAGTNVLVAGCAPLLGVHAARIGRRFRDSRATWIHANSSRSLQMLEAGLVHVAGVHLAATDDTVTHVLAARRAIPGQRSALVNLARWRQGFVVPRGNPLGIAVGSGLLRPDLRFATRDPGAGAQRLLARVLRDAAGGGDPSVASVAAVDHDEVARLVRWGVADVGVAIEATAIAHGLDFIPLAEERFDLVVSEATLELPPVTRFIEMLDEPAFRADVAGLAGYDLSTAGHVATVDAA